ncbi:MAG: diguanylate cyclase [Elusimicrobia bacterium]|nr:diguanylate cyclase [Elusimicrobiota bacterium]
MGPGAWRDVFEGLPVAATLVDARGRVLAANREARRLAGRLPAGRPPCCEYWGCGVEAGRCPLRRALRTGRTIRHARVRARGPHGERTTVERISVLGRGPRRRAVVVTGPATAFFRRLGRLRREASTDALTAVLNRRRFDALTDRAARGERRAGPRAFVMMDVDGLKGVNDLFGHAAGDRLLRRLGAILGAHVRRTDVAGRVGGDEFAVYCPDTPPALARALVRRLRGAIVADNAAHPREPALSVQFGLACSATARGGDLRERADAELYRRKRRVKRLAALRARRLQTR